MKKILLPTDFSRSSERVYELTAKLAKQMNASVSLCNLIPSWSEGVMDYVVGEDFEFVKQMDDMLFESSYKNMIKIIKSDFFKGVKVDKEIKLMSPYDWREEFVKSINKEDYDLIVIGHNEAGKEVLFFTDDLSQKVKTPVLACTIETEYDFKKPILVCTDFENVNAGFFKRINMIPSDQNTAKTIFYVNTKKNYLTDQEIQKAYKILVNKYHLKNTTLKAVNGEKAIDSIKGEISSGDYQFVALATHGSTGILKFFKNSVTEEVFDRSPIPVLSVNLHDYLEEIDGARVRTGFTG